MATGDDDFRSSSLSDILSGDVDAVDEAVVETAKPEGEKPESEAATTGEAPAGDKPDKGTGAPPAPEKAPAKDPAAETSTDPKAKAREAQQNDERRKRQAAEQRAADLERELNDLKSGKAPQQQQPQQQPQPKVIPERPDPFVDPEGARRWDNDRQTEREAANEQREFERTCALSESFMVELKGEADYREKENAFGEAIKANPALAVQLRRSANPAKFAYDQGKKFLALKEIGDDPEAFRARERERLRAEIEAELKAKGGEGGGENPADQGEKPAQPDAKAPATPAAKAAIPATLAKIASSSPAPREPGKNWNGPTPLTDIIK